MTREVKKTVSTDASGRTTKTKVVHKDLPRKTVDKVVTRQVGGAAGEKSKTRTKTVQKKGKVEIDS